MKKTAIAAGVLALACSFGAYAAEITPSVYINGGKINFEEQPYIDTEINLTMMPIRGVFEAVGASVVWDGDNQTVIGMKDNSFFSLQIGQSRAFINGEEYTLETPAVIKNDTTFVPLRFAMEALGADVSWDGENCAVIISAK